MGFKDAIHNLQEATDLPLVITEELHQVYAIDGFKRKNILKLVDAFAQYNYRPLLNYSPLRINGWDIQKAGQLSAHIQAPLCLPLYLEPVDCIPAELDALISTETAIQTGVNFFKNKCDKLKLKIPDDWQNVCEYIGRLISLFRDASITHWQWYLCTKSGTTLNFHLMPENNIDPCKFLQAKADCRRARINTINAFPYTVEIVFHAFSKIERLPFNRRHRVKYEPYAKR